MSPDLTSNTLELIKATSIASVVALPELLRMGRVAQGLVYNATPLIAAAIIYLIMPGRWCVYCRGSSGK